MRVIRCSSLHLLNLGRLPKESRFLQSRMLRLCVALANSRSKEALGILVLGHLFQVWLPWQVARSGSRQNGSCQVILCWCKRSFFSWVRMAEPKQRTPVEVVDSAMFGWPSAVMTPCGSLLELCTATTQATTTLALFEEAEGDRPRLLAGDFNLEETSNSYAEVWRSHGFVDVQELFERVSGTEPLATSLATRKGSTRKDFVYVSPEVKNWFVMTEVDPGPFPDHGLLMGHFRVPGAPEPRLLWHSGPADVVAKTVLAEGPTPCVLDPSPAYRAICDSFELQQAGFAALSAQERGLATVEALTVVTSQVPPVRKARQGKLEASFFDSSMRHVHWLKQARLWFRICAMAGPPLAQCCKEPPCGEPLALPLDFPVALQDGG